MKKTFVLILLSFIFCAVSAQKLKIELVNKILPDSTLTGNSQNAPEFGYISSIGDINGDGIPDLAIGGGGFNFNALTIHFMNSSGNYDSTRVIGIGIDGFNPQTSHEIIRFGRSISQLGDLNGDGDLDIAVTDDHNIYILFLNKSGKIKSYTHINPDQFGAYFSHARSSVSCPGDMDGDGLPDLHIAVARADSAGNSMGAVHSLRLNSDGSIKYYTSIYPQGSSFDKIKEGSQFGFTIGSAGDIDGNGVQDLIVGTVKDQVWMIMLNEDQSVYRTHLLDADNPVMKDVIPEWDGFSINPHPATSIVDIDQDGINDIVFGAGQGIDPGNVGSERSGKAFICYLDENGRVNEYEIISNETVDGLSLGDGSLFGTSCASIGDLNGDGYPEFAIGDPADTTRVFYGGAVYIFSAKPLPCEANDCVWPGDANNDGIVNVKDLINLGAGFNKSSNSKRILPVTTWVEQKAEDWQQGLNGIDFKHSDCDGNGEINHQDASVVEQNYSFVVMKMDEEVQSDPSGPPLYIVPSKDTVYAGDSVEYQILLGDQQTPGEDVYGVSMSLRHEVTEVFGSANSAKFDGNWLGTDGVDMITLSVPLNDGIDIGMSRTDQQNRTGEGYLSTVKVIMPDNLGEVQKDLDLYLTDVLIVTYEGDTIVPHVMVSEDVVVLKTGGSKAALFENDVKLFPNPTLGLVRLNSEIELDHILISDITGRTVYFNDHLESNNLLNLSFLPKGVYQIKIQSDYRFDYQSLVIK